MQITRLLIDEHSPSQSVVLSEADGKQRSLVIAIGSFEAVAISSILNDDPFPRPLTHTLAACLIKSLNGRLERVIITDLRSLNPDDAFGQMTYFAEMHIRQGDRLIVMDCRPSDAMAISLSLKAPIFAEEKVLALAAHDEPGENDQKPE